MNKINSEKFELENSNKKYLETSCFHKMINFEYRPVSTIISTFTCCIIFGIIYTIFGIIILYYSSLIKEFSIRYDNIDACNKFFIDKNSSIPPSNNNNINNDINTFLNLTNLIESNICEVKFTLFELMNPPINVYYELDNFYQNHRRFIKSQSSAQLEGKILNTSEIKLDCDPIVTVKDLGINKTFGGYLLSDDAPANPCGLFPRAFFNDSFELLNHTNNSIYINETGIAWESDKSYRFKLPINADRIQWINVTNEHFMVWMRPAGINKFRKLWGRINNQLIPGNYTLKVINNYKVTDFKGKKSFVLSTSNFLGGRNTFLGTAYVVLGIICLLTSAIFSIAYKNKISSDKKNV